MAYKYTTKANHEDLSSGRVLFNKAGLTAFPVRLTSEIFLRCKKHLIKLNKQRPYKVYDPFCGGGYILTTLGLLHGEDIKELHGSDIDKEAVQIAKRNTSLLSIKGINDRINQLDLLSKDFEKQSHFDALKSAKKIKERVKEILNNDFNIFQANFFSDELKVNDIDLIIIDVPYGELVNWHGNVNNPEQLMMERLVNITNKDTVIAIVASKKQKFNYPQLQRLERFKIGLRQILIFQNVK